MAKKEFNIQHLINLQKTVESMISNISQQLIINNAVLKKHTGDVIDTNKLYDKYERLSDQLNVLKTAVSKANSSKTSLGDSNQQLIYKLSNLTRHKSMLEQMISNKRTRNNGAEKNAYTFQISKSVLEERLLDIEEKISEIKEAMTDFNNSHTVKIVIDETLDLV